MLLKYKKVLATVSVIINVFGWGCLAGAIKVTGDLIFPALLCFGISALIVFPILISFIVSKINKIVGV